MGGSEGRTVLTVRRNNKAETKQFGGRRDMMVGEEREEGSTLMTVISNGTRRTAFVQEVCKNN